MSAKSSFFTELQRRNVLRAGVLYAGAVWALAQGLAQLLPLFGDYGWIARWFVIAAIVGFPFWIAFAWFYEFTPQGLKRESEVAADASITRSTGRKLDKWIIAVLTVAVVLLLTNMFVRHEGVGLAGSSRGADSVPGKSVAVLPLENEGGNQDEQYFSDGLSESLITALSQFNGLKVISRDSSFRFRNSRESSAAIGEKLGVAHLLEGSVRRLGGTVRINATLVLATDGSTVWSQHYDRPYKDLFKLQDDIAAAVANELRARLLPVAGAVVQSDRPPGGSLEAYNAYLHGNQFAARDNEQDYLRAIDAYREAVRIDAHYAQAYAAMSIAETTVAAEYYGGEQTRTMLGNARRDVDTALAIDPDNALSHRALGIFHIWGDLDWRAAESAYVRALVLDPGDPAVRVGYAEALASLGRKQEAIAMFRQALRSDPYNINAMQELVFLLPPEEAEPVARRALQTQPDSLLANWAAARVFVELGKVTEARALLQRLPDSGIRDWMSAYIEHVDGTPAMADAALQRLIERDADSSAYQIAELYALRRDPDRMFHWLDRAWTNRDPGLNYLLFDRSLDAYRDDPRFAAFCRKAGLPATTDAKAMP